MVKVKLPIFNSDATISHRVAVTIANNIKSLFSIDKDIYTAIGNFAEEYNNPEAIITKRQKDDLIPSVNKKNSMKVTYEEKFIDTDILSTSTRNQDVPTVFYDSELDLLIRPIYVDTELSVKISYFTKSKSKAQSLINALRLKTADNSEAMYHNLTYFYYMPHNVMLLLLDINTLKNNMLDDNDKIDFEDYLIDNSANRLAGANQLKPTDIKTDVVVKEKQKQVLGYFTNDLIDMSKEYDEDKSGWVLNIDYTVNYKKPVELFIQYPVIVYNQLLPQRYIQRINMGEHKVDIEDRLIGYTDAYKYVKTEYLINKWYRGWYYVRIPYFDLHQLPKEPPYMLRMFTVLATITKDDKKNLFNLTQLPGYQLHQDVIDYLKKYRTKLITQPYSNVFNITIYNKTDLLPVDIIEIDEELNIRALQDLDIKGEYRVSFNVVVDWTVLPASIRYEAMYNTTIGKRTIEFLALDRSDVHPGDDKVIEITEYEVEQYIKGGLDTYIEAYLIDDIFEKEETPRSQYDRRQN